MSRKKFEDFLRDSLSGSILKELPQLLSEDKKEPLSPHRLTKIKNNPRIMTAFEVLTLSGLVEKSPAWLIEEFQCGASVIDRATMGLINKTFQKKTDKA